MITFLTAIHISTVVLLVITVLLQSGKGAEISASFGGSSQTVFGASGGANFFQKLTYTLAAIFMITSLTLTILPGRTKRSVFEGYSAPTTSNPHNLPAGGTAPAQGNPNSLPVGGDATVATKPGNFAVKNEKSFTGKAPSETAPAKPAEQKK